jgi:Stress responsive A/B Barrel Domain
MFSVERPADLDWLVAAVRALFDASPEVVASSVTADLGVRERADSRFDVVAVARFDHLEGCDRYLRSDLHQRFLTEVVVPAGVGLASAQLPPASLLPTAN